MTEVSIHGLGRIGLPTAAMLANTGYDVIGRDVDPEHVKRLDCGNLPVDEPRLEELLREALDTNLTVTTESVASDYHLICVPTPVEEETGTADLSAVEAAASSITTRLRPGDVVILESTVPPGTTVDHLAPHLERSGLEVGEFSLAYSPETVLPGNVIEELQTNDRLIGGIDPDSTTAARSLYSSFVEGRIHTANDPTLVEFVKLAQNTYRDTNIALANEFAKLAQDYGIDARAAIRMANHHPRVDVHEPGSGVGGHCIPVDPWFLGHRSDALDLIECSRRVNDSMPDYIADRIEDHVGELASASTAVLGVAYKPGVNDSRRSPGLAIARVLEQRAKGTQRAAMGGGAVEAENIDIRLHDPYVDDRTIPLAPLEDALADAEAIVFATGHDEYAKLDPSRVADRASDSVVIDPTGVIDENAWRAVGFTVFQL